jgi:hypothetical protein
MSGGLGLALLHSVAHWPDFRGHGPDVQQVNEGPDVRLASRMFGWGAPPFGSVLEAGAGFLAPWPDIWRLVLLLLPRGPDVRAEGRMSGGWRCCFLPSAGSFSLFLNVLSSTPSFSMAILGVPWGP